DEERGGGARGERILARLVEPEELGRDAPAAAEEDLQEDDRGGRGGREPDAAPVQLGRRQGGEEPDAPHGPARADHQVRQDPVATAVAGELDAGAGRDVDLAALEERVEPGG